MMAALLALPFGGGIAAFLIRSDRMRRSLLVAIGAGHSLLTLAAWCGSVPIQPGDWLGLDTLGLLFLSVTSLLFLCASVYAVGYLRHQEQGSIRDFEEGLFFSNQPEAVFTGCLLFFLGTMTLVTLSQHFGLLWVAVEATTLSSAPLIYFHRHHRSLEAAWKYLLICSVGIALALLGNFCLALSGTSHADTIRLVLGELLPKAGQLQILWLKAAFLLFLVGYGTKMGLAPLHTWLPDAHSESPSVVSALLSGALLNCAFLGILRIYQVCTAAGQREFSQSLLVPFGLLSMAVAAIFIINQADFKRLLAYSSVEHMGILALAVGIGGAATFGAMFHAINHSLTKAMLFLVAGNLLTIYKTKSIKEVRGACAIVPVSGFLWIAGFLAITGSPPFGTFLSEFTILKACLEAGRTGVAVAYLVLLSLVFIGMAAVVLRMALGETPQDVMEPNHRESWLSILPPAFLGLLVLLLGLYVPPALATTLSRAAQILGVAP